MYKRASLLYLIPMFIAVLVQACSPQLPAASAENPPQEEQGSTNAVQVEDIATPAVENQLPVAVHAVIPSFALTVLGSQKDDDEAQSNIVMNGDNFNVNILERPFTAQNMEYLPDVDIQDYVIGSDDNFYYIDINLSGINASTKALTANYAVEVDLDHDGRGDILVTATSPLSAEWNSTAVSVYKDNNKDVGNSNVIQSDANLMGDGYETTVFESGTGADPDLAWARFNLGVTPTVSFALKKEAFEGSDSFMIGVLSSAAPFDPAKFNMNDGLNEAEAGSPIPNSAAYPLNLLAAVDNTCRAAIGFQANGTEPFSCVQVVANENISPDKKQQDEEETVSTNTGSSSGNSGSGGGLEMVTGVLDPRPQTGGPSRCTDPKGCSPTTP